MIVGQHSRPPPPLGGSVSLTLAPIQDSRTLTMKRDGQSAVVVIRIRQVF